MVDNIACKRLLKALRGIYDMCLRGGVKSANLSWFIRVTELLCTNSCKQPQYKEGSTWAVVHNSRNKKRAQLHRKSENNNKCPSSENSAVYTLENLSSAAQIGRISAILKKKKIRAQ